MNALPESEKEAILDRCIARMLVGERWQSSVPESADDEIFALMDVAERIHAIARVTAAPETSRRQRMRNRLEAPRSLLRQIAFYRLPYLPPLWIKREAC